MNSWVSLACVAAISFSCVSQGESSERRVELSYISGNLFCVGYLDSGGLKAGKWCYYYEDGRLLMRGSYKANLCEGVWVVQGQDGCPVADSLFVFECSDFALTSTLPGYGEIDWERLSDHAGQATEMLPSVQNGWMGAGIYRSGRYLGPANSDGNGVLKQ